MAKKKEKEIHPRILTKSIPAIAINTDESGFASLAVEVSKWRIIEGGGLNFAVWTGYIDLTGMTVTQDFSLAIQAVDVQEGFITFTAASSMTVWDLVTDVPINWDEALTRTDQGGQLAMPGFQGSNQNLENIIQGQMRVFSPGVLTNPLDPLSVSEGTIPIQSTSWGTNAATASDRLYISRVVLVGPTENLTPAGVTSPTVVAMPVIFFEEKDLSHMERLRRSYILQGPFS